MLKILAGLIVKRQWKNKGMLCCQVLSLTAIILPLLILLGLKWGFISSLKEELLRNPATLAVVPDFMEFVSDDTVNLISTWPEVGYVLPVISPMYSRVYVGNEAETTATLGNMYDMVPTSAGDPVMLLSGVPVPQSQEVVLSKRLAQDLAVNQGDFVTLTLSRNAGKQVETTRCAVVGILPLKHELRRVVYVPHEFAVNAQRFSISGETRPHTPVVIKDPVYHALVIEVDDSRSKDEWLTLLSSKIQKERATQLVQSTKAQHPMLPEGTLLYQREDRCYLPSEIVHLQSLLQDLHVRSYPWVHPQTVSITGAPEPQALVITSCQTDEDVSLCQTPPVLYVSPQLKADADHICLHVGDSKSGSSIVCLAEEDSTVPKGEARCSSSLAAVIFMASRGNLQWDYRLGALYDSEVRFRSVRLYSVGLEHTEKLVDKLQSMGIKSTAAVNRIRSVLALESGLNILFFIIAGVAAVGALVSFALSLFNAAELHRRDYALVQLMGVGGLPLALMPVLDALLSTLLAFAVSVLCYCGASEMISLVLVSVSASTHALCVLEWWHFAIFCFVCCLVAVMASVAAAIKVLRITPAEIIRES